MKHLIISGASQGIGKATAQLFSDGGYTVINLSRRKCDVEGVQNISCDFSSDSSVESGLQELLELIRKNTFSIDNFLTTWITVSYTHLTLPTKRIV